MYTFDEVLSRHVGQFGPGQWRVLSASSLCLIANAAAFFFWTFSTVNPIQHHDWECVDPTNSACQAVKQQEVPNKQDFCSLSAGGTRWTNEGMVYVYPVWAQHAQHVSSSCCRGCSQVCMTLSSSETVDIRVFLQTRLWPSSTWSVKMPGKCSSPTQ